MRKVAAEEEIISVSLLASKVTVYYSIYMTGKECRIKKETWEFFVDSKEL